MKNILQAPTRVFNLMQVSKCQGVWGQKHVRDSWRGWDGARRALCLCSCTHVFCGSLGL